MPFSAICAAGSASPPSPPAAASPRSAAPRSRPPRPSRASPIRRCGRYGYPQSFATGVIAAGGTLGIMIPPSTVLAVYGLITEQDVGKLFIAGIMPGIVAVIMYMRHHHHHRLGAPGFPAGRRRAVLERAARSAARHLGDAAAVRLRHRRHLWRHVHRHRSGRHGRRRRLHHRPAARRGCRGRTSCARCSNRRAPPPPCSPS